MIKYVITSHTVMNVDSLIIEYGIELVSIDGDETIVLDSIIDLSINSLYVEEIVSIFNRLLLSPIHFREVLDDFLALY